MNTRLLKQLCDAGQREVPREPMLMLLEFMTGLDMAEDLPTLHLGSLVWLVMTKNEARDRRLHNAQLKAPLQWGNPLVGVYELSINKCRRGGMCEDVVLLNDRFLNHSVRYRLPEGKTFDELVIRLNHSDARAYIGSNQDPQFGVPCKVLIATGEHDDGEDDEQDDEPAHRREASPQSEDESDEEDEKPAQAILINPPDKLHDDGDSSDADKDTIESYTNTFEKLSVYITKQVQNIMFCFCMCGRVVCCVSYCRMRPLARSRRTTRARSLWPTRPGLTLLCRF